MYSLGEEWKRHQLAEDEAQEGTATAIKSYGMPLSPVTFFKNLGRVLLALDKDWPEVVRNLHRARQNWYHLSRVLVREGADNPTLGRTYVAVVQAVLLHGLETWKMAPRIRRVLVGLHHSVAPSMTLQYTSDREGR